MKKQVYLVLAAMLTMLYACDSEPKFKVQGEIKDAADQTLYFEATGINGIEMLDSVKLSSTGSYSFAAQQPEAPEFYRLRLGQQFINFSIDSTETVVINSNAGKFATDYTVENSENSVKIKELVLLQMDLQSKMEKLAQNRNMPAGIVQDSLQSYLKSYKDKVKYEYIFTAPNTTYAYFALFQTLNGYTIFDPLTNKDDIKCFAAVATSMNNTYPHADRSRNLYNTVIKGMKNTRTATQQQEPVELSADQINEVGVIDIALKDLKGIEHKLSDLKGKVVLVDFTVYNNAMSGAHNLALRELYNQYASKGLEIYQISLDTDEHFWKTTSDALPWICVRDANSIYSTYVSLYNVTNLPTLFLVDKSNSLYGRGENIADLEAAIKKLL